MTKLRYQPEARFTKNPKIFISFSQVCRKLDVTKSPGPEGIHPKILHEIADQIAYPLQLMFVVLTTSNCQ